MRPSARHSFIFALGTLAAAWAVAADVPPLRSNLQLASVSTAYALGDAIGVVRSGPGCASSTSREWSELMQRRVETELSQAFRDELAKAPGSPLATNALNLKALVNDMQVQLCDLGQGAWRGDFQVQVGWQLMRGDTRQPVFQTTTAGRFDGERSARTTSTGAGLREAFAHSVRALLTNPQFVAAVKAPQNHGPNLADASQL